MDLHDRRAAFRLSPGERDVAIRLLGKFSVSYQGRQPEASIWRFRNAARLVQILALTTGHRIHREQVIDLFWPLSDGHPASNNFHQVLHHARRALTSIGVTGSTLRLERGILSLDLPGDTLWIDVDAFEAAAHAARQSRDPATCEAALAIYQGELLPEERYADWLMIRRETLHAIQLSLLQHLGESYEHRNDLVLAESAYGRLVLEDPTHEAGSAGLMRVLAVTGRRREALARYSTLEAATRRDLDAEPDASIRNLRDRIEDGTYPAFEEQQLKSTPNGHAEMPFVGRDIELHTLTDAVERCFAGRGRTLMLCGEPGVGKTRTAQEVATFARRGGIDVLWGNCHHDDGAPAYWPWLQVLRRAVAGLEDAALHHTLGRDAADICRIVPELADRIACMPAPRRMDAAQARFQLFESVAGFLQRLSLRVPLLIVLDDLHWSDQSSLLLLSHLSQRIGESRILILGTYRDTEAGVRRPLQPVLAEMARNPGFQRLPLSGLSESNVRSILEATQGQSPANAAVIHERTEGNPFFVSEMLRMMAEPGAEPATMMHVPQGVRDVITYRLSQLGASCNDVLHCAAVLGREFRQPVLMAMVDSARDETLDAIDLAIAARLVETLPGETGSFRFTHALVHDTVYDSLPTAALAQMHRRAGESIERLHAGELDRFVPELAHHFSRSATTGTVEPAVEYGLRAGDQSLSRIAYSEAISYYRRTLEVIESHDPGASGDLLEALLRLGDAHNHIGNYPEARETFLRAANVSRALAMPVEFARAADGFAGLGIFSISPQQLALLEEAIKYLPRDESLVRARILARLAFEHISAPDIERRIGYITEAESIARRNNDPSTLIFVLIIRCWTVIRMDNLEERQSVTREVVDLVEASGEVVLRPTACAMAHYLGYETGDIGFIDSQIEIFDDLAARAREPQRIWLSLIFRIARATFTGRFEEANRLIEQAGAVADGVMPAHTHNRRVLNHLILIQTEQGRLRELAGMLAEVAAQEEQQLYWRTRRFQVESAIAPGEDRLLEFRRLIGEVEGGNCNDPNHLASVVHLSLTSYVEHLPELAEKLYVILEPYQRYYLFPKISHNPYGPVACYSGRLASMLGHYDDAIAQLRAAVDMSARMQAVPFLARSQYELGRALQRRGGTGDRARAVGLFNSSAELAREVGMTVLLEEIEAATGDLPNHMAG